MLRLLIGLCVLGLIFFVVIQIINLRKESKNLDEREDRRQEVLREIDEAGVEGEILDHETNLLTKQRELRKKRNDLIDEVTDDADKEIRRANRD